MDELALMYLGGSDAFFAVWQQFTDADFPAVVLSSLLADIVGLWRQKNLGDGLVLAIDGCPPIAVQEDSPTSTTVSGTLAGIARWAAGRGTIGADIEGDLDVPPRWL